MNAPILSSRKYHLPLKLYHLQNCICKISNIALFVIIENQK